MAPVHKPRVASGATHITHLWRVGSDFQIMVPKKNLTTQNFISIATYFLIEIQILVSQRDRNLVNNLSIRPGAEGAKLH